MWNDIWHLSCLSHTELKLFNQSNLPSMNHLCPNFWCFSSEMMSHISFSQADCFRKLNICKSQKTKTNLKTDLTLGSGKFFCYLSIYFFSYLFTTSVCERDIKSFQPFLSFWTSSISMHKLKMWRKSKLILLYWIINILNHKSLLLPDSLRQEVRRGAQGSSFRAQSCY